MNILVTGGTGVLGRKVIQELSGRGVRPRVLTRQHKSDFSAGYVQGNLLEASSLPAALAGIQTLIHLASNPRKPSEDIIGTKNLIEAARQAEVKHLVLISIVGIDRMGWMPYYRVKHQQEGMIETSGIPYTIQRAAQFHEFAAFILNSLIKGSWMLLPSGFALQPIQTEAVARKLVEAALSKPAGRLPDILGPEPRTLVSLGKEYLAAAHRPITPLVIPVPGFIARLWQPVAQPGSLLLGQSWPEWLAEHVAQRNPYQGGVA